MLQISVATINYHVGFAMDRLRQRLQPPKTPPGNTAPPG